MWGCVEIAQKWRTLATYRDWSGISGAHLSQDLMRRIGRKLQLGSEEEDIGSIEKIVG